MFKSEPLHFMHPNCAISNFEAPGKNPNEAADSTSLSITSKCEPDFEFLN